MQVIVADDDPTTRRLLRSVLTTAGHEVFEAADGEAAWVLLKSTGAGLLITDWLMPRLDGIGLIQRIRADAQPGYIYTILLSARDSKSDTVAGLDIGADDYLTKPFHADELRARVAIGARIMSLELSLREARDRYAHQASHDPLTGLLNRLAISNHVQAELSRATRTDTSLSLALIDIDHFKQVNDRYGHLVGDQALCHVAESLTSFIRLYDWLGRWGGEEFLVVLAHANRAEALMVAERLRLGVIKRPMALDAGATLALTVSIGVASSAPPKDASGLPDQQALSGAAALFQRADAALYAAKRAGRNRVES
jgi:two-component system chemotaxis response regulator CheY